MLRRLGGAVTDVVAMVNRTYGWDLTQSLAEIEKAVYAGSLASNSFFGFSSIVGVLYSLLTVCLRLCLIPGKRIEAGIELGASLGFIGFLWSTVAIGYVLEEQKQACASRSSATLQNTGNFLAFLPAWTWYIQVAKYLVVNKKLPPYLTGYLKWPPDQRGRHISTLGVKLFITLCLGAIICVAFTGYGLAAAAKLPNPTCSPNTTQNRTLMPGEFPLWGELDIYSGFSILNLLAFWRLMFKALS